MLEPRRSTPSPATSVPAPSRASSPAAPTRRGSTTRTLTSTSTCRAASTAFVACGSATRSRDSSSGACGTAATPTRSTPTPGRRSSPAPAWVAARACRRAPRARSRTRRCSSAARQRDRTRTTCPYCGVGCELDVRTRAGEIVQILPVLDAPVNKGHLCVKGRYAFEFVESPDRLDSPLLRDGGGWRRASWPEAVAFVAGAAAQRSSTAHGPDAVGVLGSARSTNEENYVAQKFARRRARHQQRRLLRARLPRAVRARPLGHARHRARPPAPSTTSSARARSSCAGPTRPRGTPSSALASSSGRSPARTSSSSTRGASSSRGVPGALHLGVRPGGERAALQRDGLRHRRGGPGGRQRSCATGSTGGRRSGRSSGSTFARRTSPRRTGVAPRARPRRRRASTRATRRRSASTASGMTEHVQGTEGVMALVNLALLTGNVGKPGTRA